MARDSTSFADAREVLRLLVSRADEIRGKLKDKDIKEYLFLMDRFTKKHGRISRDTEFKHRFSVFYGLYAARPSSSFTSEYFKIMEEQFRRKRIDLEGICNRLKRKRNSKDQETLQFVFCTKLAATVNPDYPPYDRLVARALRFTHPEPPKPYEERLRLLLRFYDHLRSTVHLVASSPEFPPMALALLGKFPQWNRIPTTKQVDFLIWTAGKLISKE